MIRLLLTHVPADALPGLRTALGAVAGLEIVAEAGTTTELLPLLATHPVSVLLLDCGLPGPDALGLLPTLLEKYPQLRILVQAEPSNQHFVARAFDLGAHGYLLKPTRSLELVHALRTVAAGRPFLCSAVGLQLLQRAPDQRSAASEAARQASGLSKRELEVLALVADGFTNAEIADKLFTSKRTVETHRQNIMEKTQTRNTAALIKLAVHQGLL